MRAWVYIVRCADGSLYTGLTRGTLEQRVDQHNAGTFGGYTANRRPVSLVWSQHFETLTDGIVAERQVKGWRREKKEALIRGDFDQLPKLASRSQKNRPHPEEPQRGVSKDAKLRPAAHPSRRGSAAPQGEDAEEALADNDVSKLSQLASRIQKTQPHPEEARRAVSKDAIPSAAVHPSRRGCAAPQGEGRKSMTPRLMIQGCGSNVGKSMLVAGLARACANRGLRTLPFKPQNMSNNAAVTEDGGEIGRAQALQALAARQPTTVHMNPVLLKPETDSGSQVILQGERLRHATARDYFRLKPELMRGVLDSFERISAKADLVLVEGAGSPAEVNLRAGDIANMGFAEATQTPVILTGDIDRGGVIAQVVGTQAVMAAEDNALVQGFLINKFRGDTTLFEDGYRLIEDKTGWRGYGVVPWFAEAHRLPAEDSADLGSTRPRADAPVKIVVLALSRIANFDDIDPLAAEPELSVEMLSAGSAIPGDADLVIIPGSKSTRGDLAFLRGQGWDIDLHAHYRRGGHILGLCGGYQMLGKAIDDPGGIEGPAGCSEGLGLLDVTTEMTPKKSLTRARATDLDSGEAVSGYEIHIGQTTGPDRTRPLFKIDGTEEGAQSADGRVRGTYLHGVFAEDGYRRRFLERLGARGTAQYGAGVDSALDALASHIETHIDVDGLLAVARGVNTKG